MTWHMPRETRPPGQQQQAEAKWENRLCGCDMNKSVDTFTIPSVDQNVPVM